MEEKVEEYSIKAIPTKYNGVQFRSRLEATWAAFFDLCGWNWDYEPIDLKGWIPDFVLEGVDYNIYIEVKPFTELEEFKNVIIKVTKTGIEENILLLGIKPFMSNGEFGFSGYYSIGWCNEIGCEHGYYFNHNIFTDHGNHNIFKYRYDYFNPQMSYNKRLNNYYSGDDYNDFGDPMPLWKEAKNKVQWFPKKERKILPCKYCASLEKVYVIYPEDCIHIAKEICGNCGQWCSKNVSKREWEEIKDKVTIINEEQCKTLKLNGG